MKKISSAGKLVLRLGVIAGIALLCTGRAQTQNRDLDPTYGTLKLKVGFPQDPQVIKLTAGGNVKTKLGGVKAYIANAPDVKLFYQAGDAPLTIHVVSKADTTLLINLPDGTWVADDDGDGFPNPKLKFKTPQSGRYDIWVGTVGADTAPATLKITELR